MDKAKIDLQEIHSLNPDFMELGEAILLKLLGSEVLVESLYYGIIKAYKHS